MVKQSIIKLNLWYSQYNEDCLIHPVVWAGPARDIWAFQASQYFGSSGGQIIRRIFNMRPRKNWAMILGEIFVVCNLSLMGTIFMIILVTF